jgi:hypothetical protein
MLNLDQILSVRFFERVRNPTQKDLEAYEQTLREGERNLWGDTPSLHYTDRADDGSLYLRQPTTKERLSTEFRAAEKFIKKPEITASIMHLGEITSSPNIEWVDNIDYARDLRHQIQSLPNWQLFDETPNNTLDQEGLAVNFNNTQDAFFGNDRSVTFVKLNETGAICTQSILNLSFEETKHRLQAAGRFFEEGHSSFTGKNLTGIALV